RLAQTKATDNGKGTFCEMLKTPGPLIGFEFGMGKFANLEVIHAVRPIYLTPEGEQVATGHGQFTQGTKDGKPVRAEITRTVRAKAKPGYAVGGFTARQGLVLNGVSIQFYRIDGNRLDPRDTYNTEWIGDRTGGSEVTIDTQGMIAIGIHGKDNGRVCH